MHFIYILLVTIALAGFSSASQNSDHNHNHHNNADHCDVCYKCNCLREHHQGCNDCSTCNTQCPDQASRDGHHLDLHKYHCNTCYKCQCLGEHHTLGCYDCHTCDIQCPATTTTAPPHTHKPHTHTQMCDKIAVFDAVARNQYAEHPHGSKCSDGTRHNSDALVMELCNAPVSSRWIEGEQILKDGVCSNSTSATPFHPIFYHPDPHHKVAGVLISCDGHQLKVFYQNCTDTPRVLTVDYPGQLAKITVLNWSS